MLNRFFGTQNQSVESPTQKAKAKSPAGVARDEQDTEWDMMYHGVEEPLREAMADPEPAPPSLKSAPVAPSVRTGNTAGPAVTGRPADQPSAPLKDDLPVPASSFLEPDERTPEERKNAALEVVEIHHKRIGNTIRTLWGYKECSVYINKLIMAGGDGMGHARVGFNQDAVEAMLTLVALHDGEFGAPDSAMGAYRPLL